MEPVRPLKSTYYLAVQSRIMLSLKGWNKFNHKYLPGRILATRKHLEGEHRHFSPQGIKLYGAGHHDNLCNTVHWSSQNLNSYQENSDFTLQTVDKDYLQKKKRNLLILGNKTLKPNQAFSKSKSGTRKHAFKTMFNH